MSTILVIPDESSPGVPLTSVSSDEIDALLLAQGLTRETYTEVSISENLLYLTSVPFWNSPALTTLTFRGVCNITSLGGGSFYNCPLLTTIGPLLNKISTISGNTFFGCASLTSVNIPSGVGYIDNTAFGSCISLTNVYFYNASATPGMSDTAFDNIGSPSTAYVFASANTGSITGKFTNISTTMPVANIYFVPDSTIIITAVMVSNAGGITITGVSIPSSVTNIEANAFQDCTVLSTITFREGGVSGVTSIGANAFNNCRALTTIGNLLNGLTALPDYLFSNCRTLPSVTLPSTLTSIGSNAFQSCYLLTTLTFIGGVSGVTTIGSNAFENCIVLTTIGNLLNGVTIFPDYLFSNCPALPSVTLPSGLTSIGSNALGNCILISSIIIPSTTTTINDSAFAGCNALSSITFSGDNNVTTLGTYAFVRTLINNTQALNLISNLTSIPDGTFQGCSALTSLSLPPAITSIGNYGFYACRNLTSVTFDPSVTAPTIGQSSFNTCVKLTNASANSLMSKLTILPDSAFSNCADSTNGLTNVIISNTITSMLDNVFANCSKLTSVTLSNNVLLNTLPSIFYGCTSLNNIVIPNNYTTINDNAFYGCSGLTSIDLGNVTTINAGFYDCTSLAIVNIPASVTTLGYNSFYGCTSLVNVYFESETATPTIILNSSFGNIGSPNTAYVKEGSDYTSIQTSPATFNRIVVQVPPLVYYVPDETTIITAADVLAAGGVAITEVNMPSSVTTIGVDAFKDCINLTSIIFRDSGVSGVTTIGNSAFDTCGVTDINTLLSNVTTLGELVFRFCQSLTSVTLPASITTIPMYAFYNCNNLVSINLNNVTSFVNGCFFNCTSLASINLSTNAALTILDYFIFSGCTSLTSVTIPSNITTINNYAFRDCTSLTNVYFLNPVETPAVGSETFLNIGTPSTAHMVSAETIYTSILGQFTNYLDPTICFKEGSLILTDKGYVAIQFLRKGDLVKTSKDGFKSINMIGFKEINHVAVEDRINDQLYVCSTSKYPEVFEDLVLTGSHSILVDNFTSEKQKQTTAEVLGQIYVTDNKYRLPACVDDRASVYKEKGIHTIYHLALENDNYYMNYGIYANGLLVETCSKRYLKELSNITLIE